MLSYLNIYLKFLFIIIALPIVEIIKATTNNSILSPVSGLFVFASSVSALVTVKFVETSPSATLTFILRFYAFYHNRSNNYCLFNSIFFFSSSTASISSFSVGKCNL